MSTSILAGSTAGVDEEYGNVIPIASIALATCSEKKKIN